MMPSACQAQCLLWLSSCRVSPGFTVPWAARRQRSCWAKTATFLCVSQVPHQASTCSQASKEANPNTCCWWIRREWWEWGDKGGGGGGGWLSQRDFEYSLKAMWLWWSWVMWHIPKFNAMLLWMLLLYQRGWLFLISVSSSLSRLSFLGSYQRPSLWKRQSPDQLSHGQPAANRICRKWGVPAATSGTQSLSVTHTYTHTHCSSSAMVSPSFSISCN